jgi:triacylglycerol lipase
MSFENFIANTTQYQGANAYALGLAAKLAYADEATIINTTQSWGFSQIKFIARRETQLFIASNANIIVIAFRGTEPSNIKDWMTDADLEKCTGPFNARVHSGFDRALGYVWEDIVSTLNAFQNNRQSLWITGHSLGAALAILTTAYLRDAGRKLGDPKDKPVNGTYTFGSPRAGNHDFEHAVNQDSGSRIFRFVNNNDLVTRVPPRELDYSHVGKMLYFDAQGNTVETDPSWWYQFLEGVKGVFADLGSLGPDSFKDHYMDAYLSRLQRHINDNPYK